MAFTFLSLVLILSLAYVLDRSLSTNSIILIGVIFSMFASSVINLIISFAEDHIKSITFWTMGSLSGTNFSHSRILAAAVLICGFIILRYARELNVLAVPEDKSHFRITVPVAVSQKFFGWVFGLGKSVRIVEPESVKKQMMKALADITERYEE